MGIYSIRVQYDRSLLVGNVSMGSSNVQRLRWLISLDTVYHLLSSHWGSQSVFRSVRNIASLTCGIVLDGTTNVKPPPPLFQYAPSLFRGEKLLSPLQSFKLPLPSSSAFFQMTNSYLIIIERRSRYVTLPWQQHFWMTTNRKFT